MKNQDPTNPFKADQMAAQMAQLVVHPPNPGSAVKRITVKGRHFGGTAVYVTRSPALRGLTPRYLRGIAYDYLTYAPQVRFPGDVWNEQWLRWV